MRRILCIGSRCGSDVTHELHDLAASYDVETQVVNLCLPGGTFEQHWANLQAETPAYLYEENGRLTTRKVSLTACLASQDWDDIVSYQASGFTGMQDPALHYAALLFDYLKHHCSQAKLWLQQTWAYEVGCQCPAFAKYDHNQFMMYQELTKIYQALALEFNVGLIPVGTVIQTLRQEVPFDVAVGGQALTRDGVHLSLGYGRYVASAVWAQTLLGLDLSSHRFLPTIVDETTDAKLIALIDDTVMTS